MSPGDAAREPPPLAAEAVHAVRAALLEHYDRRRRTPSWRGETDPYRVLVSEVMLQQTRVETVEKYYGRWLERFPDLAALADADEHAVLKAWEGLGYYRRARSLHRAARICRERPEGTLPGSYAELKELPGVGDYTAGAVASIAFGEGVPAVDGNVRRVLARLFDVSAPRPAWLRDTAAGLVDPGRPGDWNQALMDLGATVCTPRGPRCDACPWSAWCGARAAGTQSERPASGGRRRPRRATFALAVMRAGDHVLLERRPADGLLGGMWAFPEREVAAGDTGGHRTSSPAGRPANVAREVEHAVLALATAVGARPLRRPEPLAAYEHRFTHIHATYLPRELDVDGGGVDGADLAWVEPGAPTALALPAVQRRILDEVAERAARRVNRGRPTSLGSRSASCCGRDASLSEGRGECRSLASARPKS
jgi:A/G-specific adenine glycosylase